ncbi:hypothetical protein DYB36_010715 [Aphanomyces astaci]|uniref:Uncharacterized protein n=1 Tax=Aphanomyces astaci TaxID=112090 RepID=A0A397A3I1_APHAT|nr:hypothetical protein DYB36_010715 [Aphanomyces astaci]
MESEFFGDSPLPDSIDEDDDDDTDTKPNSGSHPTAIVNRAIQAAPTGEGTRSCTFHEICGDILTVYRLVATEQGCHVGYHPLRLLKHKDVLKSKITLVVEDLRVSPS